MRRAAREERDDKCMMLDTEGRGSRSVMIKAE
jgi:hypothetical protein